MGRKQDNFIRGMEAGARPFEEKFEKMSEETHQMGKKIDGKLDSIGEVIDILADDLSDMQKKELYNLNTPYDLKEDLDDDEKEIVVSLLLYLSKSAESNEYQKKFLRSVMNYTGVRSAHGEFNTVYIENIENIKVQKIIMQTIMEYFYLETEDFSFLEQVKDVFEHFSVNKKGIQEIKTNIETIYHATGKEGLAEKYGFVPAEETTVEATEVESSGGSYEFPCYDGSDISEACADKINIHHPYIVLKDYLVYRDGFNSELIGNWRCDDTLGEKAKICCIHKQTGEKKIIDIDIKSKDSINGYGRYLYWSHDNGIYMIDVEDNSSKKIKDLKEWCAGLRCNERYLFYYTREKQGYIDLQSMEDQEIKLEYFTVETSYVREPNFVLVDNVIVIYYTGENDKDILYKYDLETGEQTKIAELECSGSKIVLDMNHSEGHPLTVQCGKYLISVKDSYFGEDIYYYCLDTENESFDLIQIPDTKIYGIDVIYCSAIYNYIYYYSASADIERYDILTKKRERVISSENLVEFRRKGLKKIPIIPFGSTIFSIVGNWIYYRGDNGSYKIDIREKTEQEFEM